MDKQKLFSETNEILKRLLRFTEEKKFNNFTLTDGTNITISSPDLEIGAEVYMIDELGNQTPLDNGDYVLQDGRTFTVADNCITDIKSPEGDGTDVESKGDTTTDAVEAEKQEMDANGLPEGHDKKEEEVKEGEEVVEDADKDMSKRLEDLEKAVAEIMNLLNKMGDTQNDVNEQMMSKIESFGSEPGDKPVRTQKRGYETYDKDVARSKKKVENSLEMIQMMKQIQKSRNF